MAFSTTKSEALVAKGLLEITVTLLDTAGSSTAMDLGNAETITFKGAITGTAGTVTVEASNDGTTFAALPSTVQFTAAGQAVLAVGNLGFQFYRLTLASGDSSTDWTFVVLARLAR